MPTPEQKRAEWAAWLGRRAEETARSLTENAERVRADALRILSLAEDNKRLRDAIATADLQIGDGHIQSARQTLHAAMDAE
jgi:hypothetical protein